MPTPKHVFCLCAVWLGAGLAHAEPTPSLYESRLGVIKGTSPGIEIIPARKRPVAPASAPAVGATNTESADKSSKAPAPKAGPEPAQASRSGPAAGLLSWMQPPSGRPLKDAQRLESSSGIALPTQGAASGPGKGGRPKPGG
jgi:hypothetical protein